MNRTSMLCFALAIAILAAGISHVLTLKYSYAQHERAFREIPAIAHPADDISKKLIGMYKLRYCRFTTEDLLTGAGAFAYIALVLVSNGWSHHQRIKNGDSDPIIKLVFRVFIWLLLGAGVLAGFAH